MAEAQPPPDVKEVKGGKGQPPPEVEVEEEVPMPHTCENEILVDKKFSDDKEKLKSIDNIVLEMEESHFYSQKSNLAIFRYEDVIFSIYPNLAYLKRRGA